MIDFFNNIFRVAMVEMRHLRLNLMYVIFWTITGSILLLISKPTMGSFVWFILVPWVISGYLLFSIRRFIRLHIAGESAEFLGSLSDAMRRLRGCPVETREQTGAFDNEFIRTYLTIISGIFYFQTGLFLALPLYVNYTVGGITPVIILVMVAVIFLIAKPELFATVSKRCVALIAIVYFIGISLYLVPQLGFYAKTVGADKIKIVPQSTALIVKETDELRAKQREEQNNARLREGLAWQQKNPGQELPLVYKQKVEEVAKIISMNDSAKQSPEKATVVKSESRNSQTSASGYLSITDEQLQRMAKNISGK